jgi:hypothetical protein
MNLDLEQFYSNQKEPNQSCLLSLRSIIIEQDENISETQKWGIPCFCYQKKMFCFLSTNKKTSEPYLLMVEGKHLDHPELDQGTRTRMKVLDINPEKDLPITTIKLIINDALDLYRNGIIKIK